jgi:hypothetical protein
VPLDNLLANRQSIPFGKFLPGVLPLKDHEYPVCLFRSTDSVISKLEQPIAALRKRSGAYRAGRFDT